MVTALSLVWPSPETIFTWSGLMSFTLRKSGHICDIESPGVTATVLPMMSLGVLMFFSLKPMTDIGLTWNSTPVDLSGAPLAAALIIVVTSM